jgi:8-oxo-dGTP diphosphatase
MTRNPTLKHSVALAIRDRNHSSRVLLVRRPESDDEFPGMWGLPAASCQLGETLDVAARRIGLQKLGAEIELGRALGCGTQERAAYTIQMTLYEAWLEDSEPHLPAPSEEGGVTIYTGWRWGEPSEIRESAKHGSLCSQLMLENLGIFW